MNDNENKISESTVLYGIIITFLALAVIIFVFALITLNRTNSNLKTQIAALSARVTTQANEISSLKLSMIDSSTLTAQISALIPEAQKGDTGEQGEKGDKGDAGAPGLITSLQKITATGATIGVNNTAGTASVACPSDSKIISGGCQSLNGVTLITKSYPDLNNQSWNCTGNNTSTTATDQITAHAICYK
jgi:hypothetical protein